MNHVASETHHPAYKSVCYSFLYSSRDANDSYSLVSDDEAIAKTNHYSLRLFVETSAFALCNGDNIFKYDKADYAVLAEICEAISGGRKYMQLAKEQYGR